MRYDHVPFPAGRMREAMMLKVWGRDRGRLAEWMDVRSDFCILVVVAAALAALAVSSEAATKSTRHSVAPSAAAAPQSTSAESDSMTLKGGQEGTVFRNLTIEGEDRIHVDFDRPELVLDLDPAKAPG